MSNPMDAEDFETELRQNVREAFLNGVSRQELISVLRDTADDLADAVEAHE